MHSSSASVFKITSFWGYFDAENMFFDNENKFFSEWTNPTFLLKQWCFHSFRSVSEEIALIEFVRTRCSLKTTISLQASADEIACGIMVLTARLFDKLGTLYHPDGRSIWECRDISFSKLEGNQSPFLSAQYENLQMNVRDCTAPVILSLWLVMVVFRRESGVTTINWQGSLVVIANIHICFWWPVFIGNCDTTHQALSIAHINTSRFFFAEVSFRSPGKLLICIFIKLIFIGSKYP